MNREREKGWQALVLLVCGIGMAFGVLLGFLLKGLVK